jgi:flagellar hook assembly protein FlgD
MDFEWDGITQSGGVAEPGTYTIKATQGGKAVDLQIASRIESVSYTSQGTVLNLLGFGPATFDLITRVG